MVTLSHILWEVTLNNNMLHRHTCGRIKHLIRRKLVYRENEKILLKSIENKVLTSCLFYVYHHREKSLETVVMIEVSKHNGIIRLYGRNVCDIYAESNKL